MPSTHINLKLSSDYMDMIRKIGQGIGITDISKVYGAIPTIVKFSITIADSQIDSASKVIPTLEPRILELFLLSIKNIKTLEYHRSQQKNKEKLPR